MILCKKMYLHIKDIFVNTRNIIFSRSDLSSFSILFNILVRIKSYIAKSNYVKIKIGSSILVFFKI